MMDVLGRDLGSAFRTLRASPGFALATVVTLALGIGATVTMHGYGRYSRPHPSGLEAPERLVHLGEGPEGCLRCVSMTGRSYQTIRDHARSLEQVSIFVEWEPTLRGTDSGELLDGLLVTTEIFATLGIRPLLGRLFVPDDGARGGAPVAVLGEAAWRLRLGGDATVIGRTIILDRTPYTVVGVAPADLVFPHAGDPTEVWAPLAWTSEMATEGTSPTYGVVARLREGASEATASAELAVLAGQAAGEEPANREGATFVVGPLLENSGLGTAPVTLVASVGLVLLIAGVNLAGLLIARLSARRQELAVRRALGATRVQIVRQLLAEAALLGALGGLGGMAVAVVGTRAVLGSAQVLDVRALVLALALGLTSGLAVGSWPALRFARPGLVRGLVDRTRTATGGTDTARGRRFLIVAEMALATVLLSATGLLARTFLNIHRMEPGFSAEGVLALRVWDPPDDSATELRRERVDRLVQALTAVPGVERAGAVLGLPFGLGAPAGAFRIEGIPVAPSAEPPRARMQAATPGYFAALGIPLRRGRPFSDADGADSPGVAIVNEAFAERFLPDRDPIGRAVIVDGSQWEVVGVVGTVFHGDQEQPATPEIYRPMRQQPRTSAWIALRIRGQPGDLGPQVRAAVRAFDPDLAITRLLTVDELRAGSMAAERRLLRLMAGFAVAAVLMSAVGLYGLVSYSASQRAREFGVRTALGASSGAVLRLVLAQGLRLAATGAAIGLAGSLATARVTRSLLFGVSPSDPLTLAGVAAAVCGVSLLAAWIPAWRATRVDPMASLRRE
jgi:predicted permease